MAPVPSLGLTSMFKLTADHYSCDLARDAAAIRPTRRAAHACSCVVCCVLFALDRTLEAALCVHKRNPAKWAFLLRFTQGQSRRPNLIGNSLAPDPGRPWVVAPGSTRAAGRPWVDPRSVVRSTNERGHPAVDRTHGSSPGRVSESCCPTWRV